jgi:hypothetical protein
MTQEQIIEGNKLIAEFMGAFYSTSDQPNPYWVGVPDNGQYLGTHRLQYHSSWDWLMPVVERIEGLHSILEHKYINVRITQGYVVIEGAHKEILFNTSIEGSKIKATWLAVVEFIKWYNKQKEKE